jgi:transposase
MARYELTDFEWKANEPHLPNKPRGVPQVDDRRVLNGIFWLLRSARRGVTCQSAMVHARRSTIGSTADGWPASGIV